MLISRRYLISSAPFIIAGGSANTLSSANSTQSHVEISALRWDAWYGGRVVTGSVSDSAALHAQNDVQDREYRLRSPFFAKVGSTDNRGMSEDDCRLAIGQEIEYAKQANLSSWNFARHPVGDPFGFAFGAFSSIHADLKFSLRYSPDEQWYEEIGNKSIVKLLGQRNYDTTSDGRPLLYLSLSRPVSRSDKLTDAVSYLRLICAKANVRNPYVVCLGFFAPEGIAQTMKNIGGDAIAVYENFGDGRYGQDYASFDLSVRKYWTRMKATGVEIIPTGSLGYDPRPRLLTQTHHYVVPPTSQEIYAHLRALVDWASANPDACPARKALLYAWNEFDEGGWVCPTWSPDGPNVDHVMAVRRALA